MKNGISFSDAMAVIDKIGKDGKAFPFDIKFRTLQRNSKTGGRLVEYKQVVKSRANQHPKSKAYLLAVVQSGTTTRKNPNHYKNRTRLLELQNGDRKKIHIRLIDSINGKKMFY